MKQSYVLSSYIALALAQSVPARAQVAQDDGNSVIAEIVVTAQRREETIQKASVPIAVLTGEQLTSAGLTQAKDIAAAVPGVQIAQAGSASQIFIRGVGDTGTTAITNPAVAFSVDGVSIARSGAIEGSFYDVQRVEVIKGPQGTLYGRNASGGAINVITNAPVLGDHQGYVNLEVGNYQRTALDGALNVSLSEQVAMRGAFQVARHDAYLTDGWDDQRQESGRLQLLWKPSDRLSILLGGDYTHIGGVGGGSVIIPKLPGTGAWTSVTDPVAVDSFNRAAVAAGYCAPTASLPSFATDGTQGGCPQGFTQLTTSKTTGQRGADNEFWGVRTEINYDLDFATLTFLPAYREARVDSTLYPTFEFDNREETSKQTSVEARLGRSDDQLKWVVGGFFFDEAQTADFQVLAGAVQNGLIDIDIKTRSYAAFGQATYSILDPFRVIAGVRYTSDRRELAGHSLAGNPGLSFVPSVVAGLCAPTDAKCVVETLGGAKTFSKMNWRAGVEFDLSPANMLYATAATGFKAGGFSANLAPDSAVTGPTDVGYPDSYRPETLLAYELGSRNRFFDNSLQLNVEAFLWKYDDHQENHISIDVLGNVAQTYINAGEATQYGVSVDLIAKPGANDTFSGALEYLHSEYDRFTFEQPTVNPTTGAPLAIAGVTTGCSVTSVAGKTNTSVIDCSGRQLNRAPTWTANASYAHRFVLPKGSDIEFRGSVNYVSAKWLSVDFLPALRDEAHTTCDAHLAYHSLGSKYSVRAFVRNITDEAVYHTGQTNPFVPGFYAAAIGAPRTYGVGLSASF